MRGTWIIAVLIGAALLIAGFFAQGMARLAGLPASAPRTLQVASASPGMSTSPTATPATATDRAPLARATDSAQSPAAESAAASPTIQSMATAPDPAPEKPVVATPPAAAAPAARQVTLAAPAESAARPFSAAEVRDAQCRSLRAWLAELDAMAQTRPDAASQAWVRTQRATTAERQTELRC